MSTKSETQQEKVIRSIRQWQTRLLQLDRRNVLLYFPMGKRGVKLTNYEPERLLKWIESSRNGLTFTYAERVRASSVDLWIMPSSRESKEPEPKIRIVPGDFETDLQPLDLQKRLEGLRRRYREWQEEQGINILYVALGFLNWLDADQEPACSPILLVPCDLSRTSPRDPYVLTLEESEDPIVNPSLRYKLKLDAGIELPEFGEEMTVDTYLGTVAGLVRSREEWSVERSSVFSAFPFSKLPMWQDLDLMASTDVAHPMVRLLAGDKETAIPQPEGGAIAIAQDDDQLRGARLDDLLNIRDQYAVMDADFSQLRAIELARTGANLVIHGPPGTGKSQTIANIIATLLADEKRVLFVSEKTAALDVVKRRLSEVGLGEFCLDLHSDRGKKASVYAQLKESLERRPAAVHDFPFERLASRRDELNAVVRALHAIRQPLGQSVFAIHGHLAKIQAASRVAFPIRDIASLNADRLFRIQDATRRLARRTREFVEHHTSRWHGLGAVIASPGLADQIRHELEQVRQTLASAIDVASRAATECGLPPPVTLSEAMQIARLLAHMKTQPAPIPAQWLTGPGLALAENHKMLLQAAIAERNSVLAVVTRWLAGAPPGQRSSQFLSIAESIANESSRWDRLAGSAWTTEVVTQPQPIAMKWRSASDLLDGLASSSITLQSLLGYRKPIDTRAAAETALTLAARLTECGPVPQAWTSAEAVRSVYPEVATATLHLDELHEADRVLASRFSYSIVKQVDEDMLVRYKTDHRSIWRRMRSAYKRDQRIVEGCLKQPGKLSLAEATTAVEKALNAGQQRVRWNATADHARSLLGERFKGFETDWSAVTSFLNLVESIYRDNPELESTISSILRDRDKFQELKDCAQEVRDHIKDIDALWPEGASHMTERLTELSSEARVYSDCAAKAGEISVALGPYVSPPANLGELCMLLRAGAQLEPIESRGAAVHDIRANAIGAMFQGWSTNIAAVQELLDWTRMLVAIMLGPVPGKLAQRVAQKPDISVFGALESDTSNSIQQFRAAATAASPHFPEDRTPWGAWDHAPLTAAIPWIEELRNHAEGASDWADYRDAADALDASLGTGAIDALRNATDDSRSVPDIVLRHVYISWLDAIYRQDSALRFAPRDLESVAQEFRTLDARLPVAARERVRAMCLAVLDGAKLQQGPGEPSILRHQLNLKRRQLPVRKLITKIPNLLQKLKPCFMMSPLAVSQYLPHGETLFDMSFDAVVFDEASQVFPEDAVPAIARGKQTIVVGDQKQLPPSNFFRTGDGDDDSDADEESEETENNLLAGVESILDVMVGLLESGVDDAHLQVHYRSQHDSLIRFSNNKFYEDRLLTFPSAHSSGPGLGIRSVYLPNGRFEAGGSRTNRVEADAVVETVFELMRAQPAAESIGVVALSRAQADLIQVLIDARRLTDRTYDDRFAEDKLERFFVKNLENVQGDERDHIILSIGYGPTTGSDLVPNRFGPINIEGGQRRLNVAVSRARKSMTVLHSMQPSDIRSETKGARLLRQYIEFAMKGEKSIEGEVDSSPSGDAESPFEDVVGRALIERGHRIKRQVGCAKYSIDIVILSEDGQEFDLAIECDGATYHRSPSARDRDRLRQEILERLGWRGRIHRVWSTAWIRNSGAQLDAIEEALRAARAIRRNVVSPLPESALAPAPVAITVDVPSQIGPAEAATPGESQLVFPIYVEADLRHFPLYADLRETASDYIAAVVTTVVATEGPVHVDTVVERVRSHFGIQRSGSLVLEAVMRGIQVAINAKTVKWLPPMDSTIGKPGQFLVMSAGAATVPRSASPIGTVREIDRVSDQEIAAGIIYVMRTMVGAQRDEVVKTTAWAFGYKRNGQRVGSRIKAAIKRLLTEGILVDRMGSLAVRGTDDRGHFA